MVIGPDGFLHELLLLAGGTNAAANLNSRYPAIDEETLATLRPDKVLVLMPSATPPEIAEATARWTRRLGDKSKFTLLTDWYLLLPGSHLGDTAATFAKTLHPNLHLETLPTTPPATQGAK